MRSLWKHILPVLFILITGKALGADAEIWVAISDPSSEYQVKLPVTTVRAITEGKYPDQYLHLKNVYWYVDDDGTVIPQEEGGKTYGYSSEAYVRVSHIFRIIPLTKAHSEQLDRYGEK